MNTWWQNLYYMHTKWETTVPTRWELDTTNTADCVYSEFCAQQTSAYVDRFEDRCSKLAFNGEEVKKDII